MWIPKETEEELLDDGIYGYEDDRWQKAREWALKFTKNREHKFLEDWCAEAKVEEPVAYDYNYKTGFTIYTNRPGYLIGKGGSLINKYRERLKEEFLESNDIKIVEIRGGFANYHN